MKTDETILLIERLLQHLERSTEQILMLKKRVALLETAQVRTAPTDTPAASRTARVERLAAEIVQTEAELEEVQGRIEANQTRLDENARRFARVQAEIERQHFLAHGEEARAVIMAERKRLRMEYPQVMADLEKRIAAMPAHEVRTLLIEAQGSIRQASWNLSWMRITPYLQGPVPDYQWKHLVKREGDSYTPDLDAVRKPDVPGASAIKLLRDGIRERHPKLYEVYVARRPNGPWPPNIPFPQRGFDELGRPVP